MTDKNYYYYPDPNRDKRFIYRWDRIDPIIQSDISQKPYKMSVRDHFYSLIDRDMLPNLQKTYVAFDKHVTELRTNRVLPIDCYHDAGHPVTDIIDEYYSPDDWLEYLTVKIWKFHDEYLKEKQSFPRWYKQKNHVEIWTEKEAMVNTIKYYVEKNDLQVKIVSFGGFRGLSWLNEQIDRLKKKVEEDKNIHILYLGDFDPSGEKMDDVFADSLHVNGGFGKVLDWNLRSYAQAIHNRDIEVTFTRIAVTEEQIEKYNLPWNPAKMSEEVQLKLQRDTRTAGFKLKHGGKVMATEVSALSGAHPEVFEKIVTDAVNQYFDYDIYNRGSEQHNENYTETYIKERRNYWVQRLVNTIEDEDEETD